MKLILVCGPWSSGTTAVAGMLHALGLNGVAPFFQTNDERTRNSFESLAFRETVDLLADEKSQRLKVDRAVALEALRAFRARLEGSGADNGKDGMPFFLKYPLSAMLIPYIAEVFDTRLVFVLRPLAAIEATRIRRNWEPHLGAAGAANIYSMMFRTLVETQIPVMIIRYPALLTARRRHARDLADFCGFGATEEQLSAAAMTVRKPELKEKPA